MCLTQVITCAIKVCIGYVNKNGWVNVPKIWRWDKYIYKNKENEIHLHTYNYLYQVTNDMEDEIYTGVPGEQLVIKIEDKDVWWERAGIIHLLILISYFEGFL